MSYIIYVYISSINKGHVLFWLSFVKKQYTNFLFEFYSSNTISCTDVMFIPVCKNGVFPPQI